MKKLTIVNRTGEIVLHTAGDNAKGKEAGTGSQVEGQLIRTKPRPELLFILPGQTATIEVASFHEPFTLTPRSLTEKSTSVDEKWSIAPNSYTFRLSRTMGAKWKSVKVTDDCSWRVYRNKVSRRHHQLLVLPRRSLSSFLSELPDSLPLSSLALPGTHDTMAFYGWPISQCQSLSTPLAVQLQSGIRVLDIRLAVKHKRLIAYHGAYPQRAPFQEILTIIHNFLTAPATRRETIVMSIKQEDFASVPARTFSQCVHDELMSGPGGKDMWFLENRVPTLGEVRGRVVLFSRFGGDGAEWEGGLEGLGLHPTTWPDSEKDGFKWECKNTLVLTHDWYNIPSFLAIPEKTALATRALLPPPNDPPVPTLAITYFSAASFPLAFPPTIARGFGWPHLGLGVEGVNRRVGRWLIDLFSGGSDGKQAEPRIRGWAFMDFYEDPDEGAIVPLLVECNFRGRKKGEEGWQ